MGVKYVRRCPRCGGDGISVECSTLAGHRVRCTLCGGVGSVDVIGLMSRGVVPTDAEQDALMSEPDADTQPIDMADAERRSVATTQDKLLALGLRQCLAMEEIGRSLAKLEASLRALVDEGVQVRHG